MAELNTKNSMQKISIRHRGRGAQVFIYLGKLLRMFIYQNDWKVLPMAALIAGLVGMVTRRKCFITMEGTLMGAFAMVCVCIWNGCFNSIQVICRERDVIKREHRSGMHISSYIFSHMLYQAMLCLTQTIVTLAVMTFVAGVQFPKEGVITSSFMLDFGISMFLISYASDMLSLWVSALAHNTTTAMTIMPFVLIFQLVFSGGMITLPAWTKPMTYFTISNPGLKVIAAQSDTNKRPYETISSMIYKMRDNEIGGTVTVGQVLDLLQNTENEAIASFRAKELGRVYTLRELKDILEKSATFESFKQEHIVEDVTVKDLLRILLEADEMQEIRQTVLDKESAFTLSDLLGNILKSEDLNELTDKKVFTMTTVGDLLDAIDAKGIMEKYGDVEVGGTITVGEAVDLLAGSADVQAKRDTEITLKTTVGKLMDIVGEENVKTFLEQKAAAASYNADYENNVDNVVSYWVRLAVFILAFALLATITLEFIDKDKR